MIEQNNNLLNISLLCQTAEVSHSGYYQWQNNVDTRNEKEELDKKDFELILEAYKFRGYDKGSRGIHMRLLNQGIRMNRKKIHRLMNKYKLMCPIRKANPYRRMAKAMKTNNISENLVNREFQEHGPGMILLTDTSISFRQLLKDKKLRQSMSRRGNCWDNAPQESFFGHMKDEIHLERCSSILDLRFVIDDYMDYYNNDRYQWGLAKLSPNQYSTYLKNGEYPIKI
ncbi:IS3 family transposase [Clostridium estertheticum]|uniref:IS3 family transposase n=1 Tax=Clostridium estertheticum TaxID=238834 RepID=A0AA47EG52_9CLOT|nr:IS3 family transposase [Clostridium estertheticum]WAG59537.1 IS3 family transposase [Clostridium estertheticum]